MSALARAFVEQYPELSIMPNLGAAIDAAIFPFKSGKVIAYLSDNWVDRGRTLVVEVEKVPNYHFVMSLDLISLTREPDGGLSKIYERVFKHYRYRPTTPPDDHIVLGDT